MSIVNKEWDEILEQTRMTGWEMVISADWKMMEIKETMDINM
jgi:hypothetical protein